MTGWVYKGKVWDAKQASSEAGCYRFSVEGEYIVWSGMRDDAAMRLAQAWVYNQGVPVNGFKLGLRVIPLF